MRPGPALALLLALAAAALVADHWQVPVLVAALLLGLCLRAPAARRWPYLAGCALTALLIRDADIRMHEPSVAGAAGADPQRGTFFLLAGVFFLAAAAGLMVMSQAAGIVQA